MSRFYISNWDADRCRRSMEDKAVIVVSGATAREVKMFAGVVVSLEEDHARPTRSRWRVTMDDTSSLYDTGGGPSGTSTPGTSATSGNP